MGREWFALKEWARGKALLAEQQDGRYRGGEAPYLQQLVWNGVLCKMNEIENSYLCRSLSEAGY